MKCRHCRAELTLPFVDLGTAPPSNAYLTREQLHEPERYYPLRVLTCTGCWLVQTEDYAQRDELFADDYAYYSSYSSSWLAHAERFVAEVAERFALGASSHVVEIASNDGYLLQYVQAQGIPCLGVEPTAGTAAAARAKGIETRQEFFGTMLADALAAEGRTADLVVANNVLAHVPDINDFVAGIARLLKPNGVATFEFPHLLRLVAECQFDTIYHEHYSYLSLTAVRRIFEANGLAVFDVAELSTHGGSLRVLAQRATTGGHARTGAVDSMLSSEADRGLSSARMAADFQARAARIKDDLVSFLINQKRLGRRVAGYGAAAKGNTLLNYAGIRSDLLPWVVDRNPSKQGKLLPGSRIQVVDEARLWTERPDFVLVFPWNLRSELKEQLSGIRSWGGRLAWPVPELVVE